MKDEIMYLGVILSFLAIIVVAIVFGSNWSARHIGGTQELHLPTDKKLVNATWKNSSLWLLVRPMKSDETPEVYDFIEDSNLNVFEGTVHIIEHKGGVTP